MSENPIQANSDLQAAIEKAITIADDHGNALIGALLTDALAALNPDARSLPDMPLI